MKTIGLIGGITWNSTVLYYEVLNKTVNERLGGTNFCKCIIQSLNYGEIQQSQQERNWDRITDIVVDAGKNLERAGAGVVLIGANTIHKVFDVIEQELGIPLIHIADATAAQIKAAGLTKVGLLGTRYTMTMDFYTKRLADKHGIETIVPKEDDRAIIHDVIYDELAFGEILPESRKRYQEIITRLQKAGAQGVILGCTEIPLLIEQKHSVPPVFNTTELHALAAVDWALG